MIWMIWLCLQKVVVETEAQRDQVTFSKSWSWRPVTRLGSEPGASWFQSLCASPQVMLPSCHFCQDPMKAWPWGWPQTFDLWAKCIFTANAIILSDGYSGEAVGQEIHSKVLRGRNIQDTGFEDSKTNSGPHPAGMLAPRDLETT